MYQVAPSTSRYVQVYYGTSRYVQEYRQSPKHFFTVQHGDQRGIAYPRLAGHIQITISKRKGLHCILVSWNFISAGMGINFLEQGLIRLEVASTCMET